MTLYSVSDATSGLPPHLRALSVEQVMEVTGMTRTRLYQLLRSGDLIARKMGRRTVIMQSDLDAYIASCPRWSMKTKAVVPSNVARTRRSEASADA